MGRRIGVFLIKCYKRGFAWMPNSCRYSPSCSTYAMQAIERYGLLKGSWLGLKRLLRCHPWGGHGHDPVP